MSLIRKSARILAHHSGKQQQSDAMLAALAQLNAEQAARIDSAPGERKAIPGSPADIDRVWP
jgi:hypothetical protein